MQLDETRTARGENLSKPLEVSPESRSKVNDFLSGLDGGEKAYAFQCLGEDLHEQAHDSAVMLCRADDPGDIYGYFYSYAVCHNLEDPLATSKSHVTESTDLSTIDLVPADDLTWLRDIEEAS
ncbi:MAG: hypothetical protein AAGB04_20945 [Pseudomonadota bacterium]